MFLAGFDAPHYPVEGTRAGMICAISVVKFLWPIDAYAEKEFIVVKKPAPVVIEQNSVSLHRIADLLSDASVFSL